MLYRVVRAVLRVVFLVIWRPTVEGLEHVPPRGPLLVASNHLSFVDSVVIPLVMTRRVRFLAKAEYFEARGVRGWAQRAWFRAMGAIPVRRDEQRDARASLDQALAVLATGEAFGLYPEGTRSRDGRLYRGRTGVGWLALQSGAPVLPVGVVGTDKVQPVDARVPRRAPVTVRFAPVLRPEEYADAASPAQARRRLTDDVMDAIHAMTGQERAPGYNERTPTGP
ncbi:MAG TPA: lysophospholipid acyltransferase family protein [Jiangellales bacterium]|nr:lysophospholipid acyltransferase family protein [Jiangellales bacterium]